MDRRLWVTWERQRRSVELARYFGCEFCEIIDRGVLRYPRAVMRTVAVLIRARPSLLVVQNPSMLLATVAVLWGRLFDTKVVVDRHTTFLLNYTGPESLGIRIFRYLSRITLKHADLTIVTNRYLAELVEESGGRAAVLPDKLPSFSGLDDGGYRADARRKSVLFVWSFAPDEPLEAVLDAANLLQSSEQVTFYITGRPRPKHAAVVASAPANVIFTGFLSEPDYVSLLRSVDAVVVLTTSDHTMLCGCYEAVSAEKPLVTSDKPVLREYFTEAIFVQPTAASIAASLSVVLTNLHDHRSRAPSVRVRIQDRWNESAAALERLFTELEGYKLG